MTDHQQLQTKIEELEVQLTKFKHQLSIFKECPKIEELEVQLTKFKHQLSIFKECPKIEDARVGDVLEDGSVVVWKYTFSTNNMALLMAPKKTEVLCDWDESFYSALDDPLREWVIPNAKLLRFAMKQIPREFDTLHYYWTSEENDDREAKAIDASGISGGTVISFEKSNICKVRAFRFLMY